MITVGYGEVTPNNTIERVFVIFNTTIACGIFGYALNKIGNILQNLYYDEA
jgi:hypothetical protein